MRRVVFRSCKIPTASKWMLSERCSGKCTTLFCRCGCTSRLVIVRLMPVCHLYPYLGMIDLSGPLSSALGSHPCRVQASMGRAHSGCYVTSSFRAWDVYSISISYLTSEDGDINARGHSLDTIPYPWLVPIGRSVGWRPLCPTLMCIITCDQISLQHGI